MKKFLPEKIPNNQIPEVRNFKAAVLVYFTIIVLFSLQNVAFAAGTKIVGTIVDGKTGDPLVGASVMLEGTTIGAKTNLEGKYTIRNVSSGDYTLIVRSIGYIDKRVEQIAIAGKDTQTYDIRLTQKVVESGKTVTVTGNMVQGSEAALLVERQKAIVVSDAVSAKTISRTGSSDAADAVKKITGASVIDGKYVYVRGLGGRYSNTLLNGTPLPTADPDKHSVHMDLIPAKLLDKIVVKKTFTPDQAGNFSGGSVDIGTKSMPTELTLSFSQSSGFNSRSTSNTEFLTYQGGETDWLAIDDGTRELPEALSDGSVEIPRYSRARNDSELAHELDNITRSFNDVMSPTTKRAPINQGYAFSFGNQYSLGENPLGVMASLSYNYNTKYYDDGTKNRWQRPGSADFLNPYYQLNDRKGVEEVLWGGLAGISFEPGSNNQINLNLMYNRSSESTARYLFGDHDYEFQGDDRKYEVRALKYSERYMRSIQLSGEHYFPTEEFSLGVPFRVNWRASYSENNSNTPDFRTFADAMILNADDPSDTSYITQASGIASPARWFGEMQERKRSFAVDLVHDLNNYPGAGKFKLGIFYEQTRRENRERRIKYTRPSSSSVTYDGDPNEFFGSEGTGIVDSTFRREETVYLIDSIPRGDGTYSYDTVSSYVDSIYRYEFGNVVEFNLQEMRMANYDGEQTIIASYAMMEYPLTEKLRLIFGGRIEYTEMRISNEVGIRGDLNNVDLLPSVNLIYQLCEKMNIRLAGTKTLARPMFREKMPMKTFEFNYDYEFSGNPDLERTLISNYDVRWEYFIRPGEIFAISSYYKYFDRPITRFIIDVNGNLEPRNVDYGKIYGLEFELKSRLDRFTSFLRNFTLATNVSFIKSHIKVGEKEIELARSEDPNFEDTRSMQGQSPYIVNVDLSYSNNSTTVSLMYNVFGERMTEVALASIPDVYEQPFHSLNFTASQKIIGKFKLSFKASNILDESVRKTQTLSGVEYTESEYRYGRSYSIGTSYSF